MIPILICLLAIALAPPPTAENWTPTKPGGPVPTVFPELKLPNDEKPEEYRKALTTLCPLTLGDKAAEVEAGDDAARKLLKARLQQGRLELTQMQDIIDIGKWDRASAATYMESVTDMRSIAIELWGDNPKILIPWLEEFVLLGKDMERLASLRTHSEYDPPFALNTARRHRLAAESALWKAKNPPRK